MSAPSTSPRRAWWVLGGIGAGALVAVGLVRYAMDFQDVLFVNALEIPVTVTAGGARFTLEPDAHLTRRMPSGPMDVEVVREGRTLARDSVVVTDERGLFVYNVLGAAPLYTSVIYYSRSPNPNEPGAVPQPLAGPSFQRTRPIDFVLTEPPSRMSMRKEDGQTVTRVHLGKAPGGWMTSYGWLMSLHRTADAALLAESLWKALPETPGVEHAALGAKLVVAHEEGLLASLAVSRAHRDAHPDDVDAQRLWMHEMRRAGRDDEVRAYYQAALEREPGSMLMGILLARTEPEPAATERLEKLMRDHPGELLPRRALAVRYTRQSRWAEGLTLLEAMEQSDPDYARYQDLHAEALVALGRREEAARKLAERLLRPTDKDEGPDLDDVRLYAKLVGHASREGAANGAMRQLIERAQKERPEGLVAEWLAASLGQPVDAAKLRGVPPDQSLAVATRVLMALAEEPEFAARAAAGVDFLGFRQLDTETGVLLAAEFERLGDAALAVKVLDASNAELGYGELQDVLSGKLSVASLKMLDWGERAALHLVLARQLDARGKDSKAAYALVRKEALLPGAVTIALQSWDRPKPANAVAGEPVP